MKNETHSKVFAILSLTAALVLSGCQSALMDPKGAVGAYEKSLILTSTGLMLIVVVPVIVLTLIFAFRYRASNRNAEYRPDWTHSTKIEVVVWGVPCLIVLAMAVIAWKSTHELDPYRPIASTAEPIEIDVIAQDWKWLFVYPKQGIASVNRIEFPVGTPINFRVTSDSVMNSFFIPRLGSQIFAMAGMATQLHLIASEAGTYDGMSANYSGAGFSGMKFKAVAGTQADFDAWVAEVKRSGQTLDADAYRKLAEPSQNNPVQYYASAPSDLFDGLIAKYLKGSPHGGHGGASGPDDHAGHAGHDSHMAM